MIKYYKAIWQATGSRQMVIVIVSLLIAALAAFPLHYQKNIINGLTEKTLTTSQLQTLCLIMGGFILLSLALKWILGYLSSVLGEDVIRLLRNRVCEVSAAANGSTDRLEYGVEANMVSAEAEQVGQFTGSAVSEPVMQGGTLLVVIGYIAVNHHMLGLITLCMVFSQIIVAMISQKRVNELVSDRIYILREATNWLVNETRAAEITESFDNIFKTRKRIFAWKLSSKFVVSTVTGAATVGILLVGGWQVLEGKTDVGTVVAATVGLARLQAPTKELIAYYRQFSATAVKFDLLQSAGVNLMASKRTL